MPALLADEFSNEGAAGSATIDLGGATGPCVIGAYGSNFGAVLSCSDTFLTAEDEYGDTVTGSAIFYKVLTGAEGLVQVSSTDVGAIVTIYAQLWTGLMASPFDRAGVAVQGAGPPFVVGLGGATAQADELIVCAVSHNGDATAAADMGTFELDFAFNRLHVGHKILTAIATPSCTDSWTAGPTVAIGTMAAFKIEPEAVGVPPQFRYVPHARLNPGLGG